MASLFTRIIQGEIPCYQLAENEHFIAFLDIMPVRPGHTLVVPKQEVDRLFDLPAVTLAQLLPFAQPIAKAIQTAFGYDRVNVLTLGFEVPHAHLHLMGMNSMEDFAGGGKHKANAGDLEKVQAAIAAHLK